MNRFAAACVHGSLLLVVACAAPTQSSPAPTQSSPAPTRSSPAPTQSFTDSEVTSMLKRSPLVFDGTVIREEGVPSFLKGEGVDLEKSVGRRSFMLVRVDRVHQDAALPLLHPGSQVWIGQLESTDAAKIKRATWYTQSWMSGEQLVVREVGHETTLRPKADIDRLEQEIADDSLEARLSRADVVVDGIVRGFDEPGAGIRAPRKSEHDPDWRFANFFVRQALKGDPGKSPIKVKFAASRHVAWSQSPKLKDEEVAILILHRDAAGGPYVLTDLEDKREVEEMERIEKLLHRRPAGK